MRPRISISRFVCPSVCWLVGWLVHPTMSNLFFWWAGAKTAIDLGVYTALILSKYVVLSILSLLYPSFGKSIQFTVVGGQMTLPRPLVKTNLYLHGNIFEFKFDPSLKHHNSVIFSSI